MPTFDEHEISDVLQRAILSLREAQASGSPPAHLVASTIEALRSADEADSPRRTRPRTRSVGSWKWLMRHPVPSIAATVVFILAIAGVALWFHGSGATPALADFLAPILDARTMKLKKTPQKVPGRPKRW